MAMGRARCAEELGMRPGARDMPIHLGGCDSLPPTIAFEKE